MRPARLRPLLCLFLLLLSLASFAQAEEAVPARVVNPSATSRLNLRASPSADAEVLMQYYTGVEVSVLSSPSDEWAEVRVGVGAGSMHGYMMVSFLAFDETVSDSSVLPAYSPGKAWSLLSARSTGAPALLELEAESQGVVLGMSKHWLHVSAGNVTGFVPNPASPQATATPSAAPSPTALPQLTASAQATAPAVLVLRAETPVYAAPGASGPPLIVLPAYSELALLETTPDDYAAAMTGSVVYVPRSARLWTDVDLRVYGQGLFLPVYAARETKLRTGPGEEWPAVETLPEGAQTLANGDALLAGPSEDGWRPVRVGEGADFPLIAYVNEQDVTE